MRNAGSVLRYTIPVVLCDKRLEYPAVRVVDGLNEGPDMNVENGPGRFVLHY